MFTDKELKATKDFCDRKISDILDDKDGEFTADTLRDLQTLVKLKNVVDNKIQQINTIDLGDGLSTSKTQAGNPEKTYGRDSDKY